MPKMVEFYIPMHFRRRLKAATQMQLVKNGRISSAGGAISLVTATGTTLTQLISTVRLVSALACFPVPSTDLSNSWMRKKR